MREEVYVYSGGKIMANHEVIGTRGFSFCSRDVESMEHSKTGEQAMEILENKDKGKKTKP